MDSEQSQERTATALREAKDKEYKDQLLNEATLDESVLQIPHLEVHGFSLEVCVGTVLVCGVTLTTPVAATARRARSRGEEADQSLCRGGSSQRPGRA